MKSVFAYLLIIFCIFILLTSISCSKVQAPLEPLLPITPLPVATATLPATPAPTSTAPAQPTPATATPVSTATAVVVVTGTTTPVIMATATTSPTRQATVTRTSTRMATMTATRTPIPTSTFTRTPVPTRTFTPTPSPIPTAVPIMFQNFEPGNGTPNLYFQDVSGSFPRFTDLAFEGSRALEIAPTDNNGTVRVFPAAAMMNLLGAAQFSLWVYDTQGDNQVYLALWDAMGKTQMLPSLDTGSKDNWKQVHWNLADFTDVDRSMIVHIHLRESNPGVYIFDDLRFGN